MVKCLLIDERPEGYRLTIRLDNGHVYRRRKLEQSERQLTITEVATLPDGSTVAPVKQYICSVGVRNDDPNWAVDMALVPLYEDEFDLLRELPDVIMQGSSDFNHKMIETGQKRK